jgi:molybdopterin/thiamine biosynthesis adenylyltransferase
MSTAPRWVALTRLRTAQADKLRRGRVLVAGVGGLGAPAALHLAACGIGTIGLLDADAVDVSNLQRQIIYRTSDVGRRKVDAAARRLSSAYPDVTLRLFDELLTQDNLPALFEGFDFVIDGTDRVESKFIVNDGAVATGVPFSHAGIVGFQGQTLTVLPRRSACLRCLFPSAPAEEDVPTCQAAGIIGSLAGTIGLIQACEALKFILGEGELLADRLLTYDAARRRWRTVALSRNPRCPVCR